MKTNLINRKPQSESLRINNRNVEKMVYYVVRTVLLAFLKTVENNI